MLKKFFISSCDGALHDTTAPNWAAAPLRPLFSKHFDRIHNCAQLKATLRAGEFTFPGSYQLYFTTTDGAALCWNCAKKNLRSCFWSIKNKVSDGWRIDGAAVNYEDEIFCDNCGKEIPASYSK